MKQRLHWVRIGATLGEAVSAFDRSGEAMVLVVDPDNRLLGAIRKPDLRQALVEGASLDQSINSLIRSDVPKIDSATNSQDGHFADDGVFPMTVVVDAAGCPIDLVAIDQQARPQRILVTGGAGYVGSTVVDRLLKAGHHVTVLDRFFYGHRSLAGLHGNPRLQIVEGDTRHITDIAPLVAEADGIVHLAELVGDPLCALNPLQTMEINFAATTNLVNLAAQLQVNRFVYISSCSVYGASVNPDAVLDERSPLAPLSIYAKTKILAEEAIRRAERGGFSPTIFRLGTVFGMSRRPRFDLVVNTLTAQAVQDGAISVFGGAQWRPHVHVQDVARAIELALDAPREQVAGQVLNIIGENLRIGDLGDLVIQEVAGAQLTSGTTPSDRRYYRVSGALAKQVLNFEPAWTVQQGIVEVRDALVAGNLGHHSQAHYSNIRAFTDGVIEVSSDAAPVKATA
jgi:nucleoside-diphosphate-sugar epimerase